MTQRTSHWPPVPHEIDGADVLYYAILREFIRSKAAAICSYPSGQGFYLFYCDSQWQVVEDTVHDSVDEAIAYLVQRHSSAREKLQRPA